MITHDTAIGTNTPVTTSNRFSGNSQSTSANVRTPETGRPEREIGIRTERNDGAQRTEEESTVEEARRRREELREDVVAVSEDGDTLQVSEEGNEELLESRDGSFAVRTGGDGAQEDVTGTYGPKSKNELQEIDAPEIASERREAPKPPEPSTEELQERLTERIQEEAAEKSKEARETAAREARDARAMEDVRMPDSRETRAEEPENAQETQEAVEEKETQRMAERITTYAGISNQQLEQMYRDGQISQYDYNSEIEAREARREEMRAEMEDANQDAAEFERLERNTENASDAIRTATSDEANETLTAEQRLDMIEAARNDDNLKEARREEEQGRLWDYQLLA